ncbi:MAG TPA: hypothetical protein VI583_09945 [Cyclobacteriaceae bacterium]|nr:hypothetical protein [Cyclobacteriaceae bacterium]
MKNKVKLIRILYIIGVVAMIIGALDPLEGSIVIAAGSLLVAVTTYLNSDSHWKIFAAGFVMIVIGVFFLFYLSSLGGFGGNSGLSWWWGVLVLPYPVGWLGSIIILIIRAVGKPRPKAAICV